MSGRWRDCWISFRALPQWVQWWVGAVLVPVNALPFALLDTPTGRWGACAALFVVATNIPIMLIERGMSRLMSLPHLIAWIPLLLALGWRAGSQVVSQPELALLLTLSIVNGISLAFDLIDSWRWWRGERAVPGRPSA